MQFFVYFTGAERDCMEPMSPENMAEMGRLMHEGFESGLIVSTGQLGATQHVRVEGNDVSVTDGPFIEGKELIPGYTVIRVDSKQEAVDWVARLRRCMGDGVMRMTQIHAPGMD